MDLQRYYPCGHPRSEQNSYVNSRGYRECRECRRERDRRWSARRRAMIRAQREAAPHEPQ